MKAEEKNCDERQLEQLLRGELSAADADLATAHLDHCPACRERLEKLTATAEEWSAATNALGTVPSPNQLPSRLIPKQTDYRPPRWTETLAKQLLAPPSHPEMLGRLGRYEVERLIGSGGMGLVFKAHDSELNRPVAIKLLAPHLADNGSARQRFAREARAAAAVVHPHVVPIHNVETEGELPYLVMQYVSGESLQQRLDRDGPLELAQILRIGMQVADGLAAAHQQGLVHRDIKPSNILLEDRLERALITDFGLARAADDASLTRTGFHPGTPHFMSPEQASGKAVDARSDLFSLGSMLYAMSTGRPPFREESSLAVMRQIAESEPSPISRCNSRLPVWWSALVERLMAKSPSERFEKASEVKIVLEECLRHLENPAIVAVPKLLQTTESPARKNSVLLLFGGGFLMFGLLFLAAFLYQEPAPPGNAAIEQSKSQAIVIPKEEDHFKLLRSFKNLRGGWYGEVKISDGNQTGTFDGTLTLEGHHKISEDPNAYYSAHVSLSDTFDERISISWPKENPQEGVIIEFKLEAAYYRKSRTEISLFSNYNVNVRYFKSADLEIKESGGYGTWNPETQIFSFEDFSGSLISGDEAPLEATKKNFEFCFGKSGEFEIRNLPLGHSTKRLSFKTVSQLGKSPSLRVEEQRIFDGVPYLTSEATTWSTDDGRSGEIPGKFTIFADSKRREVLEGLDEIGLIGRQDKLLFGSIVDYSLNADSASYFWCDLATGKVVKGQSSADWRKDLAERGVTEPQLFSVADFNRPDFVNLNELFPWYPGFAK